MSVICVLSQAGTVVLGTDSRTVAFDGSRIVSDATEKITAIRGGEAYIATSGFSFVSSFYEDRARELGDELGTADIRVLARALHVACGPFLKGVVDMLSDSDDAEFDTTLDGKLPLHTFVLAGRSSGMFGWIAYELWVRDRDAIVPKVYQHFGNDRQLFTTALSGPLNHLLVNDPKLRTPDPVEAVKHVLAAARRAEPVAIGGPDQIVSIDSRLRPRRFGPQGNYRVDMDKRNSAFRAAALSRIPKNDATMQLTHQKVNVGSVLRVGGGNIAGVTSPTFTGNGEIEVYNSSNVLRAWMGQNGATYGGWFGEFYAGGTGTSDAPLYVDNSGNLGIEGATISASAGSNSLLLDPTTAEIRSTGSFGRSSMLGGVIEAAGAGGAYPQVRIGSANGIQIYDIGGVPKFQAHPNGGLDVVEVRIGGQKVLGARGASILPVGYSPNASPITYDLGRETLLLTCAAKINELISRLQASTGHGLING